MKDDKVQNVNGSQKMGLWSAVALVFSGMVGSGILFLPHTMAYCGSWGFFSWILAGIMTYCMFLSFAGVNKYFLRHSGAVKNPDVIDFLRLRYCNNTSYVLSYGHFAAMVVTGAVTSIALGDYFVGLFPHSVLCVKSVASLSLLLMFVINLLSFGAANALNFGLSLLKLVFFVLISVLGAFYFPTYTPTFKSTSLLFSGAASAMFAFMGIEFGIFASGSIENPEENVIKATKYGLIASSIVFIGVYTATLFILPDLAATNTPVYDCAIVLFGSIGAKIIGVIALVSCLTSLNGNLVVQGNSLRNFAKKGYLPAFFNYETSQGFPWRGGLTSLCMSLAIIWNPFYVDLQVFAVTFIGVLYFAIIILEMMLNGISITSLLALMSNCIMLWNSLVFNVIFVSALVYFAGYLVKELSVFFKEKRVV